MASDGMIYKPADQPVIATELIHRLADEVDRVTFGRAERTPTLARLLNTVNGKAVGLSEFGKALINGQIGTNDSARSKKHPCESNCGCSQ